MKKKVEKKNKEKTSVKISLSTKYPILIFSLKAILIVAVFIIAINYSDSKGYFNPDESNNHTKKKWDSFYKFSKKNNVDIVLIGNSHLYSGINPKNLSNALGVNAFILASPGTNIADSYYCLEEALKVSNPKLIVVETYGLTAFNPYELKEGALADQFKSFSARKNLSSKLKSTPRIFRSENYVYAWSNTIRNHDFIFNDTTQLNENFNKKKAKKSKKLYLGRFVRFQKGIKENVLSKYDSLGAPVDGKNFEYNEYSKKYLDKIVNLCNEKGVEVMFLTLPMYKKHVKNNDVWTEKMSVLLSGAEKEWLNLQGNYDSTRFSEASFENTYKKNQHMTYSGSLIATYKLVDFIKTKISVKLPNRRNEKKWKRNFYGEEGYFENNPIKKSDKFNKVISENFRTNNVLIRSVSLLKGNSNKTKILLAIIDEPTADLTNCKLRLAISFKDKNTLKVANVDLKYDMLHEIKGRSVFKVMISPVDVKGVRAGALICR